MAQDSENAKHNQNVMQHGNDGRGTVANRMRHLAEGECDVEENGDRSRDNCFYCVLRGGTGDNAATLSNV